jgi:hypothetical protein
MLLVIALSALPLIQLDTRVAAPVVKPLLRSCPTSPVESLAMMPLVNHSHASAAQNQSPRARIYHNRQPVLFITPSIHVQLFRPAVWARPPHVLCHHLFLRRTALRIGDSSSPFSPLFTSCTCLSPRHRGAAMIARGSHMQLAP